VKGVKKLSVVLLAISLAASGCTTTRIMTPGVPTANASQQVHAGERARVLLTNGEVRNLKITAIDDQSITGVEGRGNSAKTVQIAMADVQSVEYRRISGQRVGRVAGGLVIGVATAAALFVAAFYVTCGKNAHKCSD
jgi:hypothetical protein